MKKEPPQPLEIEISRDVIVVLCEEGHFLADCRDKQDVLSEGSSYYLCQSDNKHLWSLVQRIDGKSITWGSKYFDVDEETSIIDLWISLKKPDTTSSVGTITPSALSQKMLSRVGQKKFMTLGMNEGWAVEP